MIPVHSQVQVEFAVGYAAREELKIDPDSITVSGPDNILDTLNQLHTVELDLKDVKRDLQGTKLVKEFGSGLQGFNASSDSIPPRSIS